MEYPTSVYFEAPYIFTTMGIPIFDTLSVSTLQEIVPVTTEMGMN